MHSSFETIDTIYSAFGFNFKINAPDEESIAILKSEINSWAENLSHLQYIADHPKRHRDLIESIARAYATYKRDPVGWALLRIKAGEIKGSDDILRDKAFKELEIIFGTFD